MRRVFIALTLTTFGGSCTMAKPPPPAHASDLTASEALAATVAWEGFGALAGWEATDPVLEPLPGARGFFGVES